MRFLLGLSVGSGFEAVDAAVVRAPGAGLTMSPNPVGFARVLLPPEVRAASRRGDPVPADPVVLAARQAVVRAGLDLRKPLAAGLLGPAAAVADRFAEQTGLTVVSGFAARDVAAGGSGRPVAAAADHLLWCDPAEDRVLVHLGGVTSVVWLRAGGKLPEVVAFEAGPGNEFLDAITTLGTRGRDEFDPGGTKAVQGKCLDGLAVVWGAHPYPARRPPKAVPVGTFGGPFVTEAFAAARAAGGTLNDLLCTATQFVAACVGDAVRRWLPPATPTRVLVSGGGVRNGFLWKLLTQQFPGSPPERFDALGVPTTGRAAAAAAVLAGLALDGVAGNLPLMTGAVGGRVLGRITPGDARNWAACAAWMARQTADPLPAPRAA